MLDFDMERAENRERVMRCLRKALEKEQERSRPRPRDLSRLRKELDMLSAKIDNAEDAVLDAPPSIRPGIYRKLEELIEQRRRLTRELEMLSRQSTLFQDALHRLGHVQPGTTQGGI